ncbi:MAG: adenosylcobinamide-phosphate synthase CbiB [Bacteroidaceae bacterium]|nr:adenosylcobinamide-phosphate synthase CbiB [Bacteroidaceae bacterium]
MEDYSYFLIHVGLFSLPLLFGWVLDLLFGDPVWLPHPVVGMGKWISMWEKVLNRGRWRKLNGALFAICSIVLIFVLVRFIIDLVTWILIRLWPIENGNSFWLSSLLYIVVCSVLVFFCLAGHTLRKEVKLVFEATDRSVEEGRNQVARIVGRDTSKLSAQECRTAALETLAENLSDGVVAPLFWFALLGIPGMFAYKMVNTMDSMIGYKNERYKDYGCWAAKIDDVANYIPARLTAILMIVVYRCMNFGKGKDDSDNKHYAGLGELFGFIFHFGPMHASPNSGWPEAALAGILDCRFGGPHHYFGEYFYKPYIGTNPRMLNTEDMCLSESVAFRVECVVIIFLLFAAFVSFFLC